MFQLYIRIILCHLLYNLAPQPGGVQHICLIHTDHVISPFSCNVKSLHRNPAYLVFIICKRICGLQHAIHFLCMPLPKIKPSGKLPHNHQIKPITDNLLFQRTRPCQLVIQISRANIGKQIQSFTNGQKPCLRP